MMDTFSQDNDSNNQTDNTPPVRSLKELIDRVTGRSLSSLPQEDTGLAEPLPYPFLALVGQPELRLALIHVIINPYIGGVLLIAAKRYGKINRRPLHTRSPARRGTLQLSVWLPPRRY